MTDYEAYKIADAILKAAGSGSLHHYTQYSRDKIMSATKTVLAKLPDWQPIEFAPWDTDLLLGWYDHTGKWCVEFGYAGKSNTCPPQSGASDGWQHGYATHFKVINLNPPEVKP